jgi:hypothetical protein
MASTTAELRRELGLRDIALMAIACIIGTRWISAAAHAGPGSILLWLLGAILFVAPLAITIGTLTAKYPSTGGFYIWTRNDFGPWHGFLSLFCCLMTIALWFPSAAMFYVGSASGHLAENRVFVVAASMAVIWIALGTNIVGLNIGKWTQNIGGAATWILAAILIGAGWLVWHKQGSATPLQLMPVWNWDTVSLLGVVAYAMTGLEMVGLVASEIHNPERDVPRAGWIASVFSVVFYAATTVALLVVLRPENITELTGLAETSAAAGRILGQPWIGPAVAILVAASAVGQFGGIGTSVARLPYAAGADNLLPAAFSRVHPRWATPYVSMLALGGVASAFLLLLQLGDTMRAAYQSMVSLMVLTGFLPFLYIFGSGWKAGKRLSAASGLAVTVVAILSSIVPTAEIHDVWAFEAKMAIGTLATIGVAWLIFVRSGRNPPAR